jgi:hypothetical protein
MTARSMPLVLLEVASLAGCTPRLSDPGPARMATLKETYDRLHERLEKATAADPHYASALGERGQVVLAIRSRLLEELAANVARRYLDRVTLDLADVEAHATGELRRKTLLGRVKLGEWRVEVQIGDLIGRLQAGSPRVRLRGPDLVELDLPVEVKETEGDATLHFSWDSAGLANAVCKDFEVTREIRARVPAQRHSLTGALRLANTGASLTATPLFPDRRVRLKLDLTSKSWSVVEAALQSQDTFGKCGLLMNPDKGMEKLKGLAARGITVHLPDSIFRTVRFPAGFRESVEVGSRTVAVSVTTRSLRVESATLWSSAAVTVQLRAQEPPSTP